MSTSKYNLNTRKERVLSIAKKCADILKEEFHVKEVHLFGSLTRKDAFRNDSDIDLAVEGLPPELYFKASTRLNRFIEEMGEYLEIDLVPLEDAKPYIRESIEKGIIMEDKNALLIDRIKNEIEELERIVFKIRKIYTIIKTGQTKEDLSFYVENIAFNLHSFYTGIERIFEAVVDTTEEGKPSGDRWHKSLLDQVSHTITNVRPAVIFEDTKNVLDDYLDFRHKVRNIYTHNIDMKRMEQLAENIEDIFEVFKKDISQFREFLQKKHSDPSK